MEEVKEYSVYKHTCPNGKVYIGITRMALEKRWANGKGYNHNAHFSRAIKKYGWDKIKHEVLYTNLTKHEASDKERELIQKYKSYNLKFGYNKDLGGCYCDRFTKKTRKKMSDAKKGKPGPKISEKGLLALKEKMKAHWNNKEYKKRALNSLNAIHCSKVKCIETGIIYNSITEASNKTGANKSYISMCCNGKGGTAKGYHWEFVEKTKRKLNPNTDGKKVAQYDYNYNLINIYNSMSEAERITGEARATIKRSADNKKKYVMKNKYVWKYVDNCAFTDLKVLNRILYEWSE